MLIFISQLKSKIWKHSNNSSQVLTDSRGKKWKESSLNKEKKIHRLSNQMMAQNIDVSHYPVENTQ